MSSENSPSSKEFKKDSHVMSYMELRNTLGVIGLIFPFILMIGGFITGAFPQLFPGQEVKIQASVSDYYGTAMRDVFVGVLVSIAFFMYTYRYDKVDSRAGNLAGLFALGVAFFPVTSSNEIVQYIHYISAFSMFCVLAYFCLGLFIRTHKSRALMTREKITRNMVYRICGYIIVGSIAALVIYFVVTLVNPNYSLDEYSFIFWVEAVALAAFGFSWLVKGEMILGDKE